jgi:hypothetical protein
MAESQLSGRADPAVILYEGKASTLARARTPGDDLWLTLPDLAAATGWELKPEGVCREQMCVPIFPGEEAALLAEQDGETWLNLAELARQQDQPMARDAAQNVWSFGPSAPAWQNRLALATAPDFTLPDFEGKPHSLSDYRGKKVFLLTWASW